MPVILPDEFKTFVEQPHADSPYVWLWEIVLDEPLTQPPSAPTWTRITGHPQDIDWPPGAGTKKWYSVPMEHGTIEQSGEGDLPSLSISIDNTGRFLMPYLETLEIDGNRASLWLINRKFIGSAAAYIRWDFEVAGAKASRVDVELRLEMPNFFERRVPEDRYNAVRCRWDEFGGPECGYIINSAASYTTCNRTIPDCVLRGLDELARGIPKLHPKRGGFFPGVPVQRLTG